MKESLEIKEDSIRFFKRLDRFIADQLPELTRSTIKSLFSDGMITSEKKIELKKMPTVGTIVYVEIPQAASDELLAEDIKLDILFEDDHLIFINKPAGLVIHPAPGNMNGTLANALLHHFPAIKDVGEADRPGIVHRLDKGTSGVMVVAKSQSSYEGLVELFSTHHIDRFYEALALSAKLKASGILESTIGRHPVNRQKMAVDIKNGKTAITHYKIIKQFESFCHIELKLETGRTHQIRVHLSALLNAPVICDSTYGTPKNHMKRLPDQISSILNGYPHPLLHAKSLGLVHPITKENMLFTALPPEPFSSALVLARKLGE